MRTQFLAVSVLLSAVLVTAGCQQPGVPDAAGTAGPIVPAPTTPSAVPTKTPTTPPSKTPATSKPPAELPAVLRHDGFKTLRLGMTLKQATATGLIGPWQSLGQKDFCSHRAMLKAGGNDHGWVYYDPKLGVEIIDAYPGVRTPEGIRIGSSHAAMLRAYPDWKNAEDENLHAEGRGATAVPGYSNVFYRILTRNGTVQEITLQVRGANCYE